MLYVYIVPFPSSGLFFAVPKENRETVFHSISCRVLAAFVIRLTSCSDWLTARLSSEERSCISFDWLIVRLVPMGGGEVASIIHDDTY